MCFRRHSIVITRDFKDAIGPSSPDEAMMFSTLPQTICSRSSVAELLGVPSGSSADKTGRSMPPWKKHHWHSLRESGRIESLKSEFTRIEVAGLKQLEDK